MSFQSLIAHIGHSHQKPSSTEKPKPSPTEAQLDLKHNLPNSQNVAPESNSTSEKQVVETPETNTKTKINTESLTIEETDTTSDLDTSILVPGLGESIFTLLIASPFLLLGFKKWLHK